MLRTVLALLAFLACSGACQGQGDSSLVDRAWRSYTATLQHRFRDAAHSLPFTDAERPITQETAHVTVDILPSGKVVVVRMKVSDERLRRPLAARLSTLIMRPPPGNMPVRVGIPINFNFGRD